MNTSGFEERKRNIYRYFQNKEKWKENDLGELTYYKGKRNLKELKFILHLVFGETFDIISEDYFLRNDGVVVGGSVTCKMYVDADFNGMYQGTKGADVYTRFTLSESAYFVNQSSTLEGLDY